MRIIVALIIVVTMSSCSVFNYMFSTTNYDIELDSYTQNKQLPKEYFLESSQKGLDTYIKAEIEEDLTKILKSKGFVRTMKKVPGSYVICYSVRIAEEDKIITGISPVHGITGTTTTGTTKGTVNVYGNTAYGESKGTETTRYNRGVVGWQTYQKYATYFVKQFNIQGWILGSPDGEIKTESLWKIDSGTYSGGEDLRKTIPFILSGIADNINVNSKGIKKVTVYPSNNYYRNLME